MMGVSFALPSMWDTLIFPFYFKAKIKLIIKLVINQQVASSCEWLGEDHLEKGGTKLAPHSLSHNRPTHSHTLKDHKPHGTHPWAPRQPRWAAMCCCPWQPRPASPAGPALACGLPGAAGQQAQHACAGCCWPCALASAARQQAMA